MSDLRAQIKYEREEKIIVGQRLDETQITGSNGLPVNTNRSRPPANHLSPGSSPASPPITNRVSDHAKQTGASPKPTWNEASEALKVADLTFDGDIDGRWYIKKFGDEDSLGLQVEGHKNTLFKSGTVGISTAHSDLPATAYVV